MSGKVQVIFGGSAGLVARDIGGACLSRVAPRRCAGDDGKAQFYRVTPVFWRGTVIVVVDASRDQQHDKQGNQQADPCPDVY